MPAGKKRAARLLAALATSLWGPLCAAGCGQRVYPKDVAAHFHTDHAGDPT